MAKRKIETKKAIVFIVEGRTDKIALEKIFQRIYQNKDIVFKFMEGDITSDVKISKLNVQDIIYAKVEEYRQQKKLKKSDIWQIIHIFDTDGTYVAPEAVAKGETFKFVYTPTQIRCKSISEVIQRNQRKGDMMDYLLKLGNIKGIYYKGYFMSSNLDHVLYNEQNLDDMLKREYADAFYEEFQGRERMFIDFLKEEAANGVPDSYPASWRYIREELHSLERHTNLHLYFTGNPY